MSLEDTMNDADALRMAAEEIRLVSHLRSSDGMHAAVAAGEEDEDAAEGREEIYAVTLDALRNAEEMIHTIEDGGM